MDLLKMMEKFILATQEFVNSLSLEDDNKYRLVIEIWMSHNNKYISYPELYKDEKLNE